MHTIV